MNSRASPAALNYRVRPTVLNDSPLNLGTDYPFVTCSGTFEVRVIVGGDLPGPQAFSFYMQGNYGYNLHEGNGRCFLQHTGGDRGCTVSNDPSLSFTGLTSQLTVTTAAPMVARTWIFKFPVGPNSIPTVSCTVGVAPTNVTVSIMDVINERGWY
jgi:hypothetical protein